MSSINWTKFYDLYVQNEHFKVFFPFSADFAVSLPVMLYCKARIESEGRERLLLNSS